MIGKAKNSSNIEKGTCKGPGVGKNMGYIFDGHYEQDRMNE